jgi:class 3 adenylate cyclase/tetratricopeptide (TPR) repeat protein
VDFFIVFTDIEGSTRLWELYPSEMFRVIARHDDIIQSACDEHGARIVKTMGDGFFIVFEDVRAVRAAVAMRNACEIETWDIGEQVKIKVGIHRSEVRERNSDFYGQGINLTARLVSAAWGSQILCTREVIEALEAQESQDAKLTGRYLGDGRLKHISDSVPLYQIEEAEDSRSFPELRALVPNPCNFGAPVMPLIGREADINEISIRLLERSQRLVTIYGIGGVGKTTLAKSLGKSLLPVFPGGVFLVEFKGLEGSLPYSIQQHFGFLEEKGEDDFKQYLSAHKCLIILDNFEVSLELRDQIPELLETYPKLQVIITSRRLLELSYENPYHLLPLQTPSEEADTPQNYDAIRLFMLCAKIHAPDFEITADNSAQVITICRAVNGVPLGIQIISTYLRVLTISSLLAKTERILDLKNTQTDAAQRHSSLGQIIEWSYSQVGSEMQQILRALAILPDPIDSVALSQIISQPEELLIDDLFSLSKTSLVQCILSDDSKPEFKVMQLIRDFLHAETTPVELEQFLVGSIRYYSNCLNPIEFIEGAKSNSELLAILAKHGNNLTYLLDFAVSEHIGEALPISQFMVWALLHTGKSESARHYCNRFIEIAPEDSILQYLKFKSMPETTNASEKDIFDYSQFEWPWSERLLCEQLSLTVRNIERAKQDQYILDIMSTITDKYSLFRIQRIRIRQSLENGHIDNLEHLVSDYLQSSRLSPRDYVHGAVFLLHLYEQKPDLFRREGLARIPEILTLAIDHMRASNYVKLILNISDLYLNSLQEYTIALEFAQQAMDLAGKYKLFALEVWAKLLSLKSQLLSQDIDQITSEHAIIPGEIENINASDIKIISLLLYLDILKILADPQETHYKKKIEKEIEESGLHYFRQYL